jgi:thiol-disulfide isomerase/thioredoxin
LDQTDTGAARLVANEAELDQLLAKTPYLVVDCMASWCGSCKQIAPFIDRLAETYSDGRRPVPRDHRATVVKIDFDVNRQITKRFGLQGIPAVMFFQQGDLRETLTGVKAYSEYQSAIERLLSP